jgi:ABC-type phosphate transport system substrate-binding protein
MKYLFILINICLCLTVHAVCANVATAQVAIIAHKSVATASVETDKILDIYTLNSKNWSDGGKITVFDMKVEAAAKARFYAALSVSPVDMQKTWLKKQFAGKGPVPIAVASEDEMLAKVAATPGAIGYVSVDKVTKDVKVLATMK